MIMQTKANVMARAARVEKIMEKANSVNKIRGAGIVLNLLTQFEPKFEYERLELASKANRTISLLEKDSSLNGNAKEVIGELRVIANVAKKLPSFAQETPMADICLS